MIKSTLSAVEARVIGCLLEKQVISPDRYPASFNAVVAACNQKRNREPAMSLTDSDVQNALELLVKSTSLRRLRDLAIGW